MLYIFSRTWSLMKIKLYDIGMAVYDVEPEARASGNGLMRCSSER